MLINGIAHSVEHVILNPGINRQLQVAAVLRFAQRADILDDVAHPIEHDAAGPCMSGQAALMHEFHPLLTGVFDVGKTHHMGNRRAIGIMPLVLGQLVNPR